MLQKTFLPGIVGALSVSCLLLFGKPASMQDRIKQALLQSQEFPVAVGSKAAVFKKKYWDYVTLELRPFEKNASKTELFSGALNPISLHLSPNEQFLSFQTRSVKTAGFATSLLDVTNGKTCGVAVPIIKNALAPLRWSKENSLAFFDQGDAGSISVLAPGECDANPKKLISGILLDTNFAWGKNNTLFITRSGTPPSIVMLDNTGKELRTMQLPANGIPGELALNQDESAIAIEFLEQNAPRSEILLCRFIDGVCSKTNLPAGSFDPVFTAQNGLLSQTRPEPFSVHFAEQSSDGTVTIPGAQSAITQILPKPDNASIYVRSQTLCGAGHLEKVPTTISSEKDLADTCPPSEFIDDAKKESDFNAAPFTLFRSKRPSGKLLLIVDGHPYAFNPPPWGPVVPLLLDEGVDVLAVDYLGNQDWEWATDSDAIFKNRLSRVNRALQYAIAILRKDGSQISLFGISYGATLAAEAFSQYPNELRSLIIVSPDLTGKTISPTKSGTVRVFQSQYDEWNGSERATDAARRYFHADQKEIKFASNILEGEQHTPQLVKSWAQIFEEVIQNSK